MNLELNDKLVLISGSSSGIGKSIADAFLQEKAKVILSGKNEVKLSQTLQEFQKKFGEESVFSFCGDLTQDVAIDKCFEFIAAKFGGLDIFVSNLGSGAGSTDWNIDDDEWHRLFDLNFSAARKLTNRLVPLIQKKGSGVVIYISSIAGKEVLGAPVHYSVAKASLNAYAKNLTKKLASFNIRVNTVCPGNILFKDGTWDRKLAENRDAVEKMLETKVPQKRFGKPEEVADLVVFLSSKRAAFITGESIVIDGGQLNHIC